MKWPKIIFATLLLLLALPLWRLLDWANLMLPIPNLYKLFLFGLSIIFLIFPLRLIITKFSIKMALVALATFAIVITLFEPLSNKATLEPAESHCGAITYTGFFYPARTLLSPSYQDDLELRNQMCWISKLIKKGMPQTSADEFETQLNLLKFKLSKPNIKYRSTLPWIAFLLGSYYSSLPPSNSKIQQLQNAHLFTQSLKFYTTLYSDEISARNYGWYEWPHSELIKIEYGFIEKNWEHIHIQLSK